jgi:hypothetical protein
MPNFTDSSAATRACPQAGFSCAINKLTARVLDLDKIKDIHELRCAYREFRPYQPTSLWHANGRSRGCTFLVGKHI